MKKILLFSFLLIFITVPAVYAFSISSTRTFKNHTQHTAEIEIGSKLARIVHVRPEGTNIIPWTGVTSANDLFISLWSRAKFRNYVYKSKQNKPDFQIGDRKIKVVITPNNKRGNNFAGLPRSLTVDVYITRNNKDKPKHYSLEYKVTNLPY